MEIYRVSSDQMEDAYFATFSHIEATLRISYSACQSVDIVKSPSAFGPVKFTVTGFIPGQETPFKHEFQATRLMVQTQPTHL